MHETWRLTSALLAAMSGPGISLCMKLRNSTQLRWKRDEPSGEGAKSFLIGAEDIGIEAGEDYRSDGWVLFESCASFSDCDGCRGFDGVAVDAATDSREGQGFEVVLAGEGEAGTIAACQQLGLIVFATAPDRADSVDHVAGWKSITAGDFGLTGLAAMEQTALGEKLWARCAVDGAVYTSATEEPIVGGVDDGVYRERGDVGLEGGDAGGREHGQFGPV